MNPSLTIGPGAFAAFPFIGEDANGNQQTVHGTVTVSDYTKCFAALFPTNQGDGFLLVPKIAAPTGGSFQVSATVNAFDANGNALPAVEFDLTVDGPPAPPLAVEIVPGAPVAVNPGNTDYGSPTDPGSGTVSFSF